jgi:uncharacterized protein YbcC (UPF0753/DUF2309 family)
MSLLLKERPKQKTLSAGEVQDLVNIAAQVVAPLWPLESPIAVNPLAGFEDLPFADAIGRAGQLFGARAGLALAKWRRLLDQGKVDRVLLMQIAVEHLGGPDMAFRKVLPGITALDLLSARLLQIEEHHDDAADAPRSSGPGEAFLAKWCAAFFDQGVAAMPMPGRERGLYAAILDLALDDPDFSALAGDEAEELIEGMPSDPLEAICLTLLDKPDQPEVRLHWLRTMLTRLPGWAGHIRWRSEKADPDVSRGAPATLTDLLGLWTLIDRLDPLPKAPPSFANDARDDLARHFSLDFLTLDRLEGEAKAIVRHIAGLSYADLAYLFMTAAERQLESQVVSGLRKHVRGHDGGKARPAAQMIFCIDVRSEPLRRAIERRGDYETLGYAGFFGLPIALRSPLDSRRKRQLPVLLEPQHDVETRPVAGAEEEARRLIERIRGATSLNSLAGSAKQGVVTSFATAEAAGPLAAAMLAIRNWAPKLAQKLVPPGRDALDPLMKPCTAGHDQDHGHDHSAADGMTLANKCDYARNLFALTGLKPEALGRIVMLVGHGASAVNNAFVGSLDCGACGGRSGGPNARALAAILNDERVRSRLRADGMIIPDDSYFLAAQHNTSTDEILFYEIWNIPASHQEDFELLRMDIEDAANETCGWRAARLGRTVEGQRTAALHWGEVRPEWGLSRNAAFIVGPRSISSDVDLDGRAFLHSYDWRQDQDGSALKTILTAPMIVAQWINCQYLFSTIDNAAYGAGDKATHNIIGGFGVLQGNEGDLCVGLPRQSLFNDDGTPYHVPQRLLTVVHAPLDRVDRIVMETPILSRLFGNGWVKLIVIDPLDKAAHRWVSSDGIMPLSSAANGWAQGHYNV